MASDAEYACTKCGGSIALVYPPDDRPGTGAGVLRHASTLPIVDPMNGVSLGEGNTPVVRIDRVLAREPARPSGVLLKCEHLNPTGSYKDRIAAVGATIARERGLAGCVGTSSGNGGAAIAAYAASAGLPLTLFVVPDAPAGKLAQLRSFGPRLIELEGLGWEASATETAAQAVVSLAHERGLLPFVTARRFSREPMEGAKTIAYELVEQVPEATAIYVPVGGGGLLAAIWRGFRDRADSLTRLPRLIAVQPSGCATVARALAGLPPTLDGRVTTAVSGLQMGVLFDAGDVVAAIQESSGHLVEVDDEEIWAAQSRLARDAGILVEPAGAAGLAGLTADMAAGRINEGDTVVLVATGAGFKDTASLERLGGNEPLTIVAIDDLGTAL